MNNNKRRLHERHLNLSYVRVTGA